MPVSSPAAQPQNRQAVHRGIPVQAIADLSPYQNNWRIKVRVVQKNEIRTCGSHCFFLFGCEAVCTLFLWDWPNVAFWVQ